MNPPGAAVPTIDVLVVDDSKVAQLLLSDILHADPLIRVIGTAADGQAALDFLKQRRPHVILMDIHMPRMDGFEATRRLKSDPATAAIPILVLTAFTAPGECERALRAGADDFLAKPCEPDALISRIRHHLSAMRM